MKTARPTESHLALTCRTADIGHFLPLGVEVYRTRDEVTDLVDARALPEDTRNQRRTLAQAGLPFYGFATIGSPLTRDEILPVVFASHGGRYQEAHSHRDLQPLARLSEDGSSTGIDLLLARTYLRRLEEAVASLPDAAPWLQSPYESLACEGCGGRGWHMCREDEITFVVACQACRKFQDDALAGMSAYGQIERGWPE